MPIAYKPCPCCEGQRFVQRCGGTVECPECEGAGEMKKRTIGQRRNVRRLAKLLASEVVAHINWPVPTTDLMSDNHGRRVRSIRRRVNEILAVAAAAQIVGMGGQAPLELHHFGVDLINNPKSMGALRAFVLWLYRYEFLAKSEVEDLL